MNKWILLTLCALTKLSMESIVGVTYRDKFDFEERYYNPNECNPFYWHPLHLPEDCAEIYSKAMRKKIVGPIRFMMKKPKSHTRYKYKPEETDDDDDDDNGPIISAKFKSPEFESTDFEFPDFESLAYQMNNFARRRNPLSPYEQMLDNLREDISYLPTAPRVTAIPGYGPVAFYQQPVSKTSKNMILQIAKIYGKHSRRDQYYPYPYAQSETILKFEDKNGDSDNTSKEENLTLA